MIVFMLKATLLIPPAIALAIAVVWLGSQHRSISTLERQSFVLRQAIAKHSSGSAIDSPQARTTAGAKTAKDKQPIDWKQVAARVTDRNRSGNMGDMREMIRFQQRLLEMSKEELVAALDEIATLDLPDETRNLLEQMILGPIAEKDPEFALTRFIDRVQEQNMGFSWQLSDALRRWSEKDPSAAVAWFDKQIAAGKFDSKSLDGKSQARIQFEGGLIRVLLGSDPDAAGRRLAALPEDQRGEVLSRYSFEPVKEEDQAAFAKLVRDQMSEKSRAAPLAKQASLLVSKDGYSEVTAYLDRIQATPVERAACVEEAALTKIQRFTHEKKITREDLDAMREWVGTQAPETTGRVTGEALSRALDSRHKMEFAEAAELAVQYHEAAGNDDVLYSFLEGWPARQNKEEARVLAARISDVNRREEVLKNLK
jgi:hypothetical protein